jgi:hypothetical protein
MLVVFLLSLYVSLPLDISYESLPLLLITYLGCSLPFFFGGLCISLVLLHRSEHVSVIYFSDLVGSGVGCVLVIFVLNAAGGPPSVLVAALCALVGTGFFSPTKKAVLAVGVGSLLLMSILLYDQQRDIFDIRMAKGFSQKHITTSEWNSLSRVAVFDLGAPFYGWAQSETWTGDVVDNKGIDIDANAFSPIVKFADEQKLSLLYDVTAVPFHIKTGHILIIGSGGGRDIVTALLFDNTVTAVEINPLIVELVNTEYGDYSGHIYDQVHYSIGEGRSFLEHSSDRYDVIQMSLVDTWAASASGAYALSESYLYTVEAFSAYLTHLTDDGMLSISRWIFDTPQQTLRLVSLAREALHREGIDNAASHIVVVRNGRVATFLLKRTPFTQDEISRVENLCKDMHFEIVYTAYHHNDPVFTELITTDDPETFFNEYPLNVSPPTDDIPFFFYTIKVSDLPQLLSLNLESESLKNNLALLWLSRLIIISCIVVLLFFLIPTGFYTRTLLDRKLLVYFTVLGIGFMCVEIPLMQKFMLILGHPTYAVSVVLFSLLVSGGIGSYLTQRLWKKVGLAILYLMVMIVVCTAGFSVLADYFLKGSFMVRVASAVAVTSGLGIAMGMPFPAGIKVADSVSHAAIPWVWSINGAASVLGSALAVFVGINFGFSVALLSGAACYALAFLCLSSYVKTM